MVFRTTGVGLLALMMRAERTQAGQEPDDLWLVSPSDADTLDDEPTAGMVAAE